MLQAVNKSSLQSFPSICNLCIVFAGEHKIHFIPDIVGSFLDMTLVREQELRQATIPIFFDMLEVEQKAWGSFKTVRSVADNL